MNKKVRELNYSALFFMGENRMENFQNIISGFEITTVVGNVWYVVLIMVGFDILTGVLAAAKEKKVNSSINYVGMIRKVGEFIALAFFVFMDAFVKADGYVVKLGVGLIVAYEGMSIIENFARIGIDVKFLTKYFDKTKVGKGE